MEREWHLIIKASVMCDMTLRPELKSLKALVLFERAKQVRISLRHRYVFKLRIIIKILEIKCISIVLYL